MAQLLFRHQEKPPFSVHGTAISVVCNYKVSGWPQGFEFPMSTYAMKYQDSPIFSVLHLFPDHMSIVYF